MLGSTFLGSCNGSYIIKCCQTPAKAYPNPIQIHPEEGWVDFVFPRDNQNIHNNNNNNHPHQKDLTSKAPRKLIFGIQLAFNLTRRNIEKKIRNIVRVSSKS